MQCLSFNLSGPGDLLSLTIAVLCAAGLVLAGPVLWWSATVLPAGVSASPRLVCRFRQEPSPQRSSFVCFTGEFSVLMFFRSFKKGAIYASAFPFPPTGPAAQRIHAD
jgi:hypothetical protein